MFPVRGEDRTRHSPFQSRGGKRSAGPPAPPQFCGFFVPPSLFSLSLAPHAVFFSLFFPLCFGRPSFAGTSFTDWTAVGTPGVYKNSSVPQSKEEAKRQASPFAVEGEPEGQESPAAAASGSEEVGGNGGQQGSQGETDQEEKQEQQQDETEAAEASGPWPHVVEDHF